MRVSMAAWLLCSIVLGGTVNLRAEEASPDATVALEQFRAGWKPQKGHMRPVEDAGWKVRMIALRALARRPDEAVSVLTRALDDESADVRIFAAQALGFVAGPGGDRGGLAKRLEKTLGADSDAAVRLYAADALGMLGDLGSSVPIDAAMRSDPNGDVRKHVGFALERQGKALGEDVRKALADFDLGTLDSARRGQKAPEFELESAFERRYRLSQFRGKQAVVIVFIYGDT